MSDKKTFMERLKKKKVLGAIFFGLVPLLANAFGMPLPVDYSEIVYAVLGILVMLGIVSNPDDPEKPLKDYLPKDPDDNDKHI